MKRKKMMKKKKPLRTNFSFTYGFDGDSLVLYTHCSLSNFEETNLNSPHIVNLNYILGRC